VKYTLLEMTQRILESLEDDEVNSITDTASATQVANIIKENFFFITGRSDLPEHFDFFQLTASGDPSLPVSMTVPENVLHLEWVKYQDTSTDNEEYVIVQYKAMDDFLRYIDQLNTDESNVATYVITGNAQEFEGRYTTDAAPKYYTTYDDNTLLFDSFNSDEDTTLVGAKTMCYGQLAPVFTLTDTFIPDLDSKEFQLLLQTSKAQAFEEMKQTPLQDARIKERRGWNSIQRQKRKVSKANELDRLPNYGRKR
jgi:hypothetical protein